MGIFTEKKENRNKENCQTYLLPVVSRIYPDVCIQNLQWIYPSGSESNLTVPHCTLTCKPSGNVIPSGMSLHVFV